MSRSHKLPLFATFARTNALFLHFRFLVQTFFSQFMSYIYDTAIRGNFDAFLEILKSDMQQFPDIFALAEYHSSIMDDILTACLLRSGQKAAGDVLRGCLETILELGVLTGELTRGRIEEYQAKPILEGLYEAFKSKMIRLVSFCHG
jgi:Gamma tubulin complex component C-terminal